MFGDWQHSPRDSMVEQQRPSLFSWFRGKRTRPAADSSLAFETINNKRRNSPPPTSNTEDSRVWDRVGLPALAPGLQYSDAVSTSTAPASSCSALSRAASWDSTSAGAVVVFSRLHSKSEAHDDSGPTLSVETCFTPAARPIDIPFDCREEETNSVLQEAARQSLGEMDYRMSLPSARASRRHKRRDSDTCGRSQLETTSGSSATTADKERTAGLPVYSGDENSVGGGSGKGGLATSGGPSPFWKRGSARGRFFDDPSPSNHSCGGGFEGYFVDTPRSSVVDGSGREGEGEREDALDEDADDLMFDLES